MRLMRVRVASVVAKTIPREPPMTAVSSMNVPTRPVKEKAARPRDIVRTYPTSTASICQYDPSVAKNPKPIPCRDDAWEGALLVLSRSDVCATSVGEDAPSATSTNTMTERTTCGLLTTQLLYAQPWQPAPHRPLVLNPSHRATAAKRGTLSGTDPGLRD